MKSSEIRVRFAPSPTGPLHIGGVRTALYNFLFAKKHNGKIILRIEDTDQSRFIPGAEEYIIESLSWCGIMFDEGVHIGGQFEPYRQSQRKDIYRQYVSKLIENGLAYYAFDTLDDLDRKRKDSETAKSIPFQYDVTTRYEQKNSLSLPENEVNKLLAAKTPYVIRIKIPENEKIQFNDLIRGNVEVQTNLLDDKVLFKSDGMPTYHLANVVDDYLMNITHVIRGEEWLPSAPLHILLYRFLGWENSIPEFVHLPLLLKPDGKGKLSKRDGDRLGFPVFPLQWRDPLSGEISSGYREAGYLPDAFINILAFLGWNPGTTQEIFDMQELINSFSFDRVSKSGAKFDVEKAKWFNHQYLQKKDNAELIELLLSYLVQQGISVDRYKLEQILPLVKERVNQIPELWDQMSFFFCRPNKLDESLIKKRWKPETSSILVEISVMLENSSVSIADQFASLIKSLIQEKNINLGSIMLPLRIALVGSAIGPDLFLIMEILGKDETILRIRSALEKINT